MRVSAGGAASRATSAPLAAGLGAEEGLVAEGGLGPPVAPRGALASSFGFLDADFDTDVRVEPELAPLAAVFPGLPFPSDIIKWQSRARTGQVAGTAPVGTDFLFFSALITHTRALHAPGSRWPRARARATMGRPTAR